MEFQKLYPRKDSEKWVHGSAVWALKDHPQLQIYKGRTHPAHGMEWIIILESSEQQAPQWLVGEVAKGRRHWSDPNTLRLFPANKFTSLREAKDALRMVQSRQNPTPGQLPDCL